MIAEGTISGNRIVANTEIKAPIIKGGTIEASKFKGGSININDRFIVNGEGQVLINYMNDKAGMMMKDGLISITDESGTVRVKIGDLR